MAKSLRTLQAEERDLAARVNSMHSGGYTASALVLADRLTRTRETIRRIQEHQGAADGGKVLVTPSNLAQFEPDPTKAHHALHA